MKRQCKVCGKTLAILNKSKNLCFAHNPVVPQYEFHPITKCTSFRSEFQEWSNTLDGLVQRPGVLGYNDRAFYRDLVYPDLEAPRAST